MSFIHGLGIGLAMIIFIGPVFFTLLKASISGGFKAGAAVATGIILSDVAAISLCLLGARAFFENADNQYAIAICAGVVLVVIGLKYIFFPGKRKKASESLKKKDLLGQMTSGFLVNFINPFVFIVWLAVVLNGREITDSSNELLLYLSGVLIGIFSTDLLKAFLAQRISRVLTDERLKKVYLLIGIAMVAFGIRAFYHATALSL